MKKTYFYFSRSAFDDFLEGQAFITIQKINDAAILVTMLFQAFAHDDVGLVRIDANVVDLAFAIVQKRIQDAV